MLSRVQRRLSRRSPTTGARHGRAPCTSDAATAQFRPNNRGVRRGKSSPSRSAMMRLASSTVPSASRARVDPRSVLTKICISFSYEWVRKRARAAGWLKRARQNFRFENRQTSEPDDFFPRQNVLVVFLTRSWFLTRLVQEQTMLRVVVALASIAGAMAFSAPTVPSLRSVRSHPFLLLKQGRLAGRPSRSRMACACPEGGLTGRRRSWGRHRGEERRQGGDILAGFCDGEELSTGGVAHAGNGLAAGCMPLCTLARGDLRQRSAFS